MAIKLSDHFTYGRLIRFALPSIAMMVFTSIYSVIDGLFVSNLVGTAALAAVNLIFPLAAAFAAFGFMLGTGGAALVAKTMGEGDQVRADRLFSFIIASGLVGGIAFTGIALVVLPLFLSALGASGELMEFAMTYGRILAFAIPVYMIANIFQSFFIAAEKPHVGLAVMTAAGVVNIVLDYFFIAVFGWGIAGAAWATLIGQVLAAVIPVLYFFRSTTARLHFARPLVDFRALGKTCVNGSSELMTEVAASIVATLYNYQLMIFVGTEGVAAYGVIMYVNFIFTAMFFGYAMGTGPIVSYHYGAQHHYEMKNLLMKSLIIIGVASAIMVVLSQTFAQSLVSLFVGYDAALVALTVHGFRIYALSFLFCGFNIYGSAFFTALNNGKISALIAFIRTLILETSTVMILPLFFGINGIWSAIIVAEVVALILTIFFLVKNRKRYQY